MRRARSCLCLSLGVGVALGCAERGSQPRELTPPSAAPPTASSAAPSPLDASSGGLDPAAMDVQVNPCDDLYRHACGGYLTSAQVPPNRQWVDLTGDAISDRRRELSRAALAQSTAARTAAARCQDEASIEAAGIEPLQGLLSVIQGATSRAGFSRALAALHSHGIDAVFSLSRGIDRGLVAPRGALAAPQSPGGALVSPHRLRLTPASSPLEALNGDTERLTTLLTAALGWLHRAAPNGASPSPLEAEVAGALRVEQRLYQAMPAQSSDELTQPGRGSNPGAGPVDWSVYMTSRGVSAGSARGIEQRASWWPEVARALTALSSAELQSFLRFRLLLGAELALPREARSALGALALAPGETAQRPRRDRCERWAERAFQGELGPAFAELALPRAANAEATALVASIRAEAARHFDEPDARSHLAEVVIQLGAGRIEPEHSLAKLTDASSFGELWLTVTREAQAGSLRQLMAPVERERMPVLTSTPNLFYHPGLHAVVAPAGYLLPPNFVPGAAPEQNYARLGFGLAHELAHAFDAPATEPVLLPYGKMDAGDASAGRGAARACLAKALEAEGALPEGALAERRLNEVMADIAGIQMAYAALEAQLTRQSEAERAAARRRFWLHYAQSHCRKTTEAGARWLAAHAAHPPNALRVNLTARHVPTLARDLGCAASAPRPVCTSSDAP